MLRLEVVTQTLEFIDGNPADGRAGMRLHPVRSVLAGLIALVVGVSAHAEVKAMGVEEIGAFVERRCATCHRLAGAPGSKFELKAPDLTWAGQKFQRDWLLGFLQGHERSPYLGPYRWDRETVQQTHPVLTAKQAAAVADWLETEARSPLVKEAAFDPSQLTESEARAGLRLYREYSCTGCHQIPTANGPVGGPSSTHFLDAGRRYDPDWVYAFNRAPSVFAPHSGEYEPDVSERKVRWVTGYLLTLGVDDFDYAKPWQSEAFKTANAKRGKAVFRTYCAQCHGLSGKGDGPAAVGLEPKPAKLAQMALDQLELQYLYELVYYGGKAVGKSVNMPDWGVTLTDAQIADVIAYLQTTFVGTGTNAAVAMCPQPRQTERAPADIYGQVNPLEPTPANLAAGKALYDQNARPLACQSCHGVNGDGLGPLGAAFAVPPRNFTCAQTMTDIPDGQLFWVIRNGIPAAGMPPYRGLSDEEIWQLVSYLRQFYEKG